MQTSINNELQLTVPMDVCSLCDLRWRAWPTAAAGVAAGMMDDILIALHEAVANALTHSDASSIPPTMGIPVLFVRTRLATGHRLDSAAWITSGESSTAFTQSVNVLI